eukprot:scaffold677771_cov57-Prasinocladus_malaysianus.AAC.1
MKPEKATDSSSRPANKRKRTDRVTCTVDTCDLEFPRITGRVIHVCPEHRSAAQVDINGVPSRFCQQCSRPHEVTRFKGLQRGCMDRLLQRRRR